MQKRSYLLSLILTLIVGSYFSAFSQDNAEPNTESETLVTTSTVPYKKSVVNNLTKLHFDEQTGQNTTATTTSNNGYVFPTPRERFHRYVKSTIGPFSLLRSAASAGIQQWDNSPLEWGQGMEGYGKRFVSSVGSNAIRQTVTYGLSEGFKLDTGFEKSKHTKFWPRFKDAMVQNVTSRTRSGKRVLSAPIIIGAYAGTIIPTETWYPERYSYKDGLRGGSYTLLMGFGVNLLREFVFNW